MEDIIRWNMNEKSINMLMALRILNGRYFKKLGNKFIIFWLLRFILQEIIKILWNESVPLWL